MAGGVCLLDEKNALVVYGNVMLGGYLLGRGKRRKKIIRINNNNYYVMMLS